MHQDHNPISQRIDEMRGKWKERVKDDTLLIRWLLKATDARTYEGFCRIEASPHGLLDELFVFFYTPFENPETFSRNIIRDWMAEIKKDLVQAGTLQQKGFDVAHWNDIAFSEAGDGSYYNLQLTRLMDAFRQLSMQQQPTLVLSLLPGTVSSAGGYGKWMNQVLQIQWPARLRILVFDHQESSYWGSLFEQNVYKCVTLHHDLRMNDAVREIATGGDQKRPDVQFRQCMYQMGDAAAKRQLDNLHTWGKKSLDIGTQSGQKDLLATAYITYAAMLFTFRENRTIHMLLDNGIRVCKQEIASGNEVLNSLLLQFYGYKGACYQQQKDTKLALEWFMKQGSEANAFGLYTQSVSGYYKAFLLAHFKNLRPEEVLALSAAINNTPHLKNDELQSTEYPYIAYEYVLLANFKASGTDETRAAIARRKMEELYGEDWQLMVEKLKQNFNKKHIEAIETAPA